MSKTPISIRLRADEWEEVALILSWACGELDMSGLITSASNANKFSKIISNRVEESK